MSIQVKGLTKIYGTQKAVDNISFELSGGEILGFLGPNGAGKSTTMKMLTCFIPQTSGEALVCGHSINEATMEVRRSIGYLPEHNPLYKDMYVKEYLGFVARMHGLGSRASSRVEQMIKVTGLTPERRKKIGQLSKGFRQRVGLAQAMIHDPQVLILDEPTSGLDPNQLEEIRGLIKELGKDKTVILSTHIMQEVQALCDRVIIINKGQIVADDKTENLRKQGNERQVVIVEFMEEIALADWKEALKGCDVAAAGKNTWRITASTSDDLRAKVAVAAKEKNMTVLRLEVQQSSIEDVFKSLTK